MPKDTKIDSINEDAIMSVDPTDKDGQYLITYYGGDQVEQELDDDQLEFSLKQAEQTQDKINARDKEPVKKDAPQPKAASREPVKRRVGSKTWNPSSLTNVQRKDPNYKYRWINTMINGQVEKMLSEGWEKVVRGQDTSDIDNATLSDGAQMGSMVQRRELLLMRIPTELNESRSKYYQNQEQTEDQVIEQHQQKMGEISGETVGYSKVEN